MFHHNMGSTERYAWLAVGIAAGAAAIRMTGWPRTALGTLAMTGLGTALADYSPISRVMGRSRDGESEWPLDQGLHDTELRRHAAMHSALGTAPTTGSSQERVTRDSDMFNRPQ